MTQVALITGDSRGIGFGIAGHQAKNGFDLAINGVSAADEAARAIDKLKDFDNDVVYWTKQYYLQITQQLHSCRQDERSNHQRTADH